jgi:hypothetical protein
MKKLRVISARTCGEGLAEYLQNIGTSLTNIFKFFGIEIFLGCRPAFPKLKWIYWPG